jgi:hypothetical protein
MSVPIINQCQKRYKPDPENVLSQILRRIPEKFLIGLDEIRLFDYRPRKNAHKSFACKTKSSHHSMIEIYMDDPAFSSLLQWNFVFMSAIDEHIAKCLKPYTIDEEILSCHPKANYQWFYIGTWNPLLLLFRISNYLVAIVPFIHKIWLYLVNRLIVKHR